MEDPYNLQWSFVADNIKLGKEEEEALSGEDSIIDDDETEGGIMLRLLMDPWRGGIQLILYP